MAAALQGDLRMQFQPCRADAIAPRAELHHPAAEVGGRVDRRLHGGGIVRYAVARGAEIAHMQRPVGLGVAAQGGKSHPARLGAEAHGLHHRRDVAVGKGVGGRQGADLHLLRHGRGPGCGVGGRGVSGEEDLSALALHPLSAFGGELSGRDGGEAGGGGARIRIRCVLRADAIARAGGGADQGRDRPASR